MSYLLAYHLILYVFFFILGTIVGSFLNVIIYRLPREQSIIKPASHCPKCKTPIKPYDNIPILSYIILGGKCRHCGEKISFRYPLVEFLTGSLFLAVIVNFGLTFYSICTLIFVSSLVAVTFIDLDFKIIPNEITIPGTLIFFLIPLMIKLLKIKIAWKVSLKDSLIGILVGGGVLALIAILYEKLRKKEGMGFGDVKLLAYIGAFLGWEKVILTLFIGSFTGLIIMLPFMLLGKAKMQTAIPFGPFLVIGAFISLFWGDLFLLSLMYNY